MKLKLKNNKNLKMVGGLALVFILIVGAFAFMLTTVFWLPGTHLQPSIEKELGENLIIGGIGFIFFILSFFGVMGIVGFFWGLKRLLT